MTSIASFTPGTNTSTSASMNMYAHTFAQQAAYLSMLAAQRQAASLLSATNPASASKALDALKQSTQGNLTRTLADRAQNNLKGDGKMAMSAQDGPITHDRAQTREIGGSLGDAAQKALLSSIVDSWADSRSLRLGDYSPGYLSALAEAMGAGKSFPGRSMGPSVHDNKAAPSVSWGTGSGSWIGECYDVPGYRNHVGAGIGRALAAACGLSSVHSTRPPVAPTSSAAGTAAAAVSAGGIASSQSATAQMQAAAAAAAAARKSSRPRGTGYQHDKWDEIMAPRGAGAGHSGGTSAASEDGSGGGVIDLSSEVGGGGGEGVNSGGSAAFANRRRHLCAVCGRELQTASALKSHERSHAPKAAAQAHGGFAASPGPTGHGSLLAGVGEEGFGVGGDDDFAAFAMFEQHQQQQQQQQQQQAQSASQEALSGHKRPRAPFAATSGVLSHSLDGGSDGGGSIDGASDGEDDGLGHGARAGTGGGLSPALDLLDEGDADADGGDALDTSGGGSAGFVPKGDEADDDETSAGGARGGGMAAAASAAGAGRGAHSRGQRRARDDDGASVSSGHSLASLDPHGPSAKRARLDASASLPRSSAAGAGAGATASVGKAAIAPIGDEDDDEVIILDD